MAALAAVVALAPGLSPSTAPVAAAADGTSRGYWFVAGDGGIFSFGDARFQGSTGNLRLNQPIVGMAATPTGNGYWFVAADGGIFSFGDAKFYGSTGNLRLNKPIVGMAPTPTGKGYWFVASDGGIFSFGDAKFFGSTGAIKLNRPIVDMAATPTGNGYWFVASDGGIFSFGDAKFHGSTGTGASRSPIVSMAASPTGKGYWFAAQDGTVYSFGDAGFFGSMGGRPLGQPIVGLALTETGRGYWLVGSDGGIFSFGDAGFFGSTGAMRLNRPIVGLAAAPPRADGGTGPGGNPGTNPTATTAPGPGATTTTTVPGTPTTTPPTTIPPGNVNWGAVGDTVRIDKSSRGGGDAFRPWMSDNGRFVVFDSSADNILGKNPDGTTIDSNGIRDVFVYDQVANTYTRVNVPTGGGQAEGASEGDDRPDLVESERPTISGDGCRIAFYSGSTNLVQGDTNGFVDAFVHDRCVSGGRTVRVSVGPDGAQANDYSARPVISRNGRYVAFESPATNLIGTGGLGGLLGGGGNDSNGSMDIFVHDLGPGELGNGGVTSRVSVTDTEQQANGDSDRPTISADGTRIAFHSEATNLFGSDSNGTTDVFVRDIHTSTTRLVSAAADGTPADKSSASPSISADGRFVAFASRATNLMPQPNNDGKFDIYVKDITNLPGGAVTQASVASDGTPAQPVAEGSVDPTISGDGNVIAFWSDAANLVPGDTNAGTSDGAQGWDVFVHDRRTGITRRASVSSSGEEANRNAFSPALSTDGRFLAFDSDATTLTGESPTSRSQDIFVHVL